MAAILDLTGYKALRAISNTEKDAQITAALPPAESAVIEYVDRNLNQTPTAESRVYPYEMNSTILNIDDCTSVADVKIITRNSNRTLTPGWDYELGRAPSEPVISWLEVYPNLDYYGIYDYNFQFTHTMPRGPYRFPFVSFEVTAMFGWEPSKVPASARQAVAWMVDEIIAKTSDETGKTAESIADLSYVYRDTNQLAPAVLPPRVAQILDNLRRASV